MFCWLVAFKFRFSQLTLPIIFSRTIERWEYGNWYNFRLLFCDWGGNLIEMKLFSPFFFWMRCGEWKNLVQFLCILVYIKSDTYVPLSISIIYIHCLLLLMLLMIFVRNSDCISNYVDRVRICDTKSIASESVYSKASSQKSGWRQKSYSSIDLSTNDHQPGAGAFRYRDFDEQDDISIKNLKNNKNKEIQRDYEDIYNVNPKGNISHSKPHPNNSF